MHSTKSQEEAVASEASKTESRKLSQKCTTVTGANEEVNEVFQVWKYQT
jgi:hypothetical protein